MALNIFYKREYHRDNITNPTISKQKILKIKHLANPTIIYQPISMYTIYKTAVKKHVSQFAYPNTDYEMALYPIMLPKMRIITKYGMSVLLRHSGRTETLCKCLEIFDFIINVNNAISFFEAHFGEIGNHDAKCLLGTLTLLDVYHATLYMALDPLRIINDHILEANYEVPTFWHTLNSKINETVKTPIIKYLLIRDYIITNYNMDDIAEYIMMIYFDIERIRVNTILYP